MGNLIGRGERPAVEILRWMFSDWKLLTQVSIRALSVLLAPKNYMKIAERHLNSSLDILITKDHKMIAVRIQDKHHTHDKMSQMDEVQKTILNDFKIKCVDVPECDCPQLFKDKVNYKSVNELTSCLIESEVTF